jgi:hypothetical protein
VRDNLVNVEAVLDVHDAEIFNPAQHACALIGQVHKLPASAPRISVLLDSGMREGGKYRWYESSGELVDIRMNPRSDHIELTTVLEIGHYLDHQVIGNRGEFASVAHPRLADWRKAVESSRAYEQLLDMRTAGSIPVEIEPGRVLQYRIRNKADVLLQLPEMFSRSYAQYVAIRTGDRKLRHQLGRFSSPKYELAVVPEYWAEHDFGLISDALERLILELGWRRLP